MRDKSISFEDIVIIIGAIMVLALLVLLAFAIYSSIHSLSLKSGIVISKTYSPSHEEILYHDISSDSKHTVIVPYTVYYGAEWNVVIDGMNPKGEHLHRTLSLSEHTFDGIHTGDRINQYGEPQ